MLEIAALIAICIIMGKIASQSDCNGVTWGLVTAAICLTCLLLIPLPLFRMLIAAVVSFVVFFIYRLRTSPY